VQTQKVLESLVLPPPSPEPPAAVVDTRSLPRVLGDGGYGNQPSRERAQKAGFRLHAPSRGQKQTGVGKIRNAVERCHNFFAQFGRIARGLDRSAQRFLGWIQLAACVIFIRSGFVR
jgi:transposase